MPKFSKKSRVSLESCHSDLQKLFDEVIKHFDCTVLQGHRGKELQNEYYRTGRSKVKYPMSKHNSFPSLAVDVAPYPINWNDKERFYFFAGYVKAMADQMGIKIRWGGDWDGDTNVRDQTFMDLPHYELIETEEE
jgi:peptidoglycan L-alanyl-D-glutamate endopeptidase CwlK